MSGKPRRTATAVKVSCERGHTVVTFHPWPAIGPASQMEIRRAAARYRPGLASYLTGAENAGDGWVKLDATSQRLAIDEFLRPGWAKSVTWACRCGIQRVDERKIIDAALAWSLERKQTRATPAPRRVVAQR